MQNKSPSPLREKDRLRPCAAARAFSATEKGKAITSRRQATRLAAPRRHTVMSVAADLHRLPLLSAPRQKSGGRNSSRVIIVSDIIPCPRQIVNRAALFCGGWARSALGGFAALLSAALFFAETLPLGGYAAPHHSGIHAALLQQLRVRAALGDLFLISIAEPRPFVNPAGKSAPSPPLHAPAGKNAPSPTPRAKMPRSPVSPSFQIQIRAPTDAAAEEGTPL